MTGHCNSIGVACISKLDYRPPMAEREGKNDSAATNEAAGVAFRAVTSGSVRQGGPRRNHL
jgi:hypothetical protein